jgi:hypothetical protein
MADKTGDSWLRALLGPEGPELTCDECFEKLDHYVELELAGADADAAIPGMTAHFAGCQACAEDHATLLAFVASQPGELHPSA